MKTKNSYPSSEFETEDKCPSCGSSCNIHTDLDDNDNCNDCRNKINILELGQIIPKEEPKQELERGITITHVGKQETIEETAEKLYPINNTGNMFMPNRDELNNSYKQEGFIKGAKSDAAKEYWFNKLKEENNLYSQQEVIDILTKKHIDDARR